MDLLKRLWKKWKRFGHLMSDFVGRILLVVFYYSLLAPFGLAVRAFGDILDMRPAHSESHWKPRHTTDRTMENVRQQY